MRKRTAVIIGAGPAGLTAAYELLTRTDIKPIVIEKSARIGGISTTIDYKGYKMDIGGHRFFTKSDRVMNWWLNHFKLEKTPEKNIKISYQNNERNITSDQFVDPKFTENVFLIRKRKSRIFLDGKFIKYPINVDTDTLKKLGIQKSAKIIFSYIKCLFFQIKPEKNLEDFYINRFGYELYSTFFKTYTEKVWGVSCREIDSNWGRQRVKGLSVIKIILHFFKKTDETSLIDQFLYPKYGPGQFWEKVAGDIKKMGGNIITNSEVNKIIIKNNKIAQVFIKRKRGKTTAIHGDYFFSTMAISDLVRSFDKKVPAEIASIAQGLQYRDFIMVGILLKKVKIRLDDTWIYVHDPKVRVGRIQVFNNWSPNLVKDNRNIWLGLEYFCNTNDNFWKQRDPELIKNAESELINMGFADQKDFLDGTVVKMNKVYPSYTGVYKKFSKLRNYLDKFDNLFPVGRNGMHKYNNQDHSMLTAMMAVDNIIKNTKNKSNLWNVNVEQEYHEK